MEKMMKTRLCVDMTKKTVTRVYPANKDGDEPKPETFEFDCDYTWPPRTMSALKNGASLMFAAASASYFLY